MKVLMLSHSYPSPNDPVQAIFVRQQVRALMKRGVRFHILSPRPWAPPFPGYSERTRRAIRASRETPRAWEMDGLRIKAPRHLKLPGFMDMGLFGPLYYGAIRRLVHRIYRREGFDLIHGQWLVPDGYAAARLGQELGIPSVATERGYIARCPDRGLRRNATKKAIDSVDQVIAVSEAIAERVRAIGEPKREVRVVYTGVDQDAFSPIDPAIACLRLGLPAARRILCVAGLTAIKQPHLVLRAFQKVTVSIPDVHLCWVGDGIQRRSFEAALAAAGLSKSVRLVGRVSHVEIPLWLAAAEVVVLGSRDEGLPNVLVEASACARPIVATRVGGIPEIVRDSETGLLVEHDNPEGMAAAIKRLLENPELARKMGKRGRERVLGRFSWEKHAEDMLGIYEETLRLARRGRQ